MTYFVRASDVAPRVRTLLPPNLDLPRACIIGAGSSGLAGVPFDCFEQGEDIGGNWKFDNSNGQSACYETLEINTSCPRMAFSDFPMPKHFPAYARHDQVHEYFEAYVDHFGFRERITFRTTVTQVAPDPETSVHWLVTVEGPRAS